MADGDEILTKADIAERYKMPLSTVNTNCSRYPDSLPPFFKMGNSANSPIRFRRSDCDAWDAKGVADELKQREKASQSLTDLLDGALAER